MLLNIKNKLVDIKNLDVLYNIYYNLAEIPTVDQLKKQCKDIKNPQEYIIQIKKEISQIDNFIPLYSVFSKNIYLINPTDVYSKVINYYNRPLTIELYNYLKSIKTNDKILKEKIQKNLKFMDNFDLPTLEQTYIKTFYYQSNKVGRNFTLCIKPSFIPFININPYYQRDELINLGLNLKIIKDDNIFYDKEKLNNLCLKISNQDIDSDTLLNHYLFIQMNNLKYYIKYYSFMGSYQMNYYIRNKSIKDSFIENNINQFYKIISKSPSFNNDYYVYRLIGNDNFLNELKIGDIYEDNSFISTSRNPFYNPVTNAFGLILLKIRLPKGKEGVGLCVENYSLFPEEQEIILNPCRLKLISKEEGSNKDIVYYHIDKKAQRSIKRKYEFEYIEPIKLDLEKITKKYESEVNIPTLDLYDLKIEGSSIDTKMDNFTNLIPLINTSKRFYILINDTKYLMSVNKMNDKRIYEKFFYLQKKKYTSDDIIDELYITYQDEKSGELLLVIEIKDVISVNYLQKFTGCNKEFNDNDLLYLIGGFSKAFQLYSCIIHPTFKPFSTFINVQPNDYKLIIEDEKNEQDYHSIQKLSNDIVLFNHDLMNYLISKKDRFSTIYIKMNYKRTQLDKLKYIKVSDVFNEENYEIYSLIKKQPLDNLNDLLIYFYKNYFYLLEKVIYHINVYLDDSIIINKLFYVFDCGNYLYEQKKINYSIDFDSSILDSYISKLDVYNVKEKDLR
jgi:hypothetical protein